MSNPSWTSKLQVKKEGFSTSLDWLYYLEIFSNNPIQDSWYPFGSLWRKGMMRRKTMMIMMKFRRVLK